MRILRLSAAFAAVLALSACATTGQRPATVSAPAAPVTVGIVAINDFHGSIEIPRQSVPIGLPDGKTNFVPAGGGAWVASAVDSIRQKYANHLTVSAGDLTGASQLASSLYLDEPTIGVMNRIGLDFNAVGNHEFDRGKSEILRLAKGGCVQNTLRKPCQIEAFKGASFEYLAANTIEQNGRSMFPGTALRSFGTGKRGDKAKVTVGLIGVTLKDTGNLVSPDNLGSVHFTDEADTINALVPKLKAKGADAIVVLIHQGGRTKGPANPQGCDALWGDILKVLDRLDARVDVVVSGHTHWDYICDYSKINPAKPFLLTSAGVFGELVTDISIQIDPASHRVIAKQARNVIVQSEPYEARLGLVPNDTDYPVFTPRADVAAYVARYVDAAKQFTQRPVGKLAGSVMRPGGDESRMGGTLGNLIADAQLAATASAGAQIAFMNPFGIRSPHLLLPAADHSLTFGQIYAIQPFNNTLVTQTLSGAELKEMLEQGFDNDQPVQFLAPSKGFFYSTDLTRPIGDRVVTMTLNGKEIDPAAEYRITTNSFLANGGDSFRVLARQRDAVIGKPDIDALEEWLQAVPPRAVPDEQRVLDLRPDVTPIKPPTLNSIKP